MSRQLVVRVFASASQVLYTNLKQAVKMNTQTVKQESQIEPSFLMLPDGRKIAYRLTEGELPGVVFLGGFRSDMTGTKAVALEEHCRRRGQRFLRFDYTGHGRSSGNFMQGTISGWKQDAIDIIDDKAPGPNILVGSSMGGWIMLLVALERQAEVAGLLGIASAPDFTHALIEREFNAEQKKQLREEGVVYVPDCYGSAPFPITRALIEDGNRNLLLDKPLNLAVPVRLIHGMKDEDVPWQVSAALAECLESTDVTVNLVKNAGHRLSDPGQLQLLAHTLDELLSPEKQTI
jgi:pimeloyl-ACP methyl ester carboxylesterase